jgi:hypothetical protein
MHGKDEYNNLDITYPLQNGYGWFSICANNFSKWGKYYLRMPYTLIRY